MIVSMAPFPCFHFTFCIAFFLIVLVQLNFLTHYFSGGPFKVFVKRTRSKGKKEKQVMLSHTTYSGQMSGLRILN